MDLIADIKEKLKAQKATKQAALKDQLIIDAGELEKLINLDVGWKVFVKHIQKRIDSCRAYKQNTKLATADNATKKRVELLEYQADILEWVIAMPKQLIDRMDSDGKTDSKPESGTGNP